MKSSTSRRVFLKQGAAITTAALAAPMIIPRSALADGDTPGANDRIGVAGIGVGRQGSGIFRRAAGNALTQPVAACDVYQPRAEAIANSVGLDAKDACQDYRRILERTDVDAITTATPEHWRGLICVSACQAGKHVYAEKPMTLTIDEGKLMVAAARKYDCVFQTGSHQRSQRENFIGCEFIRNGGIGQVKEVIAANYESPWYNALPEEAIPEGLDWEMWCGPTEVVPFNKDLFTPRGNPGWLSFRPYSGGEMTGWGTHGFDQIQCALGTELTGPTEIMVDGDALEPPTYAKAESRDRGNRLCSEPRLSYKYSNGVTVRLDNGNRGGGIFVGSKAKMEVFRGNLTSNPKEMAQDLLKNHPRQNQDHVSNWLECCLTGERPIADVEIGHRSASICHLLNIARLLGRNLKWDPVKEEFIGDAEANTYLSRSARKGYELPTEV